jgi:phosphopantothenoylcysteine decarboxylase/phosphopantothenate--cysteine ligase
MASTIREVVLGVGGGIAAYKSADLLRRLQDLGYGVTVVPTPASLNFVGAATWEALSGRPVTTQVWEKVDQVRHVSLAKSADYFIIAPATADLIARLATGRADDLLTNLVLASTASKLVVPAMHPNMWTNPATQSNVGILRSRGFIVLEPDSGRLTGNDSGAGRFPTTERILSEFCAISTRDGDLSGKNVLVTAGGTREAIDPVRFIGNHSSGKQGIAVAKAAHLRGAHVTLIAANIDGLNLPGIKTVNITDAESMLHAVENEFAECDILVMAAAVADAKPIKQMSEKIKKADYNSIDLEETIDILKAISAKKGKQIMVGFAAETRELLSSATSKLEAKHLDLIYVNDVSDGAIFGQDQTQGTILLRNGENIPVSRQSKDTLSDLLLDYALKQLG